ncbi:MAG: hypothetical protein J6W50_03560, partial [Bacteroidaceae bacterium]|nr:hypothetical protein [Bacteroidaceae bacterium]
MVVVGLFFGGELGDVLDFQANCTFTYTTLPYPIYDPTVQEEYHAAYNYTTSTLMAIPALAKDTAFSAASRKKVRTAAGPDRIDASKPFQTVFDPSPS